MANYIEKCENITVPLIPLMGAVFAFPGFPVMIDVSAPYLKGAVEYAEKTDSYVFLVTQKNPFAEKLDVKDLYSVGTLAKIKQVSKRGEKGVLAVFESIYRGIHTNIFPVSEHFMCDVIAKDIEIVDNDKIEEEALFRSLKRKASSAISYYSAPSKDLLLKIEHCKDVGELSDLCGAMVLTKPEDKYALLYEYDKIKRAELALSLLDAEIQIIKLESALKRKTNSKIEENQKEYYLREQLKVIQAELGNDSQSESEELYDEIISKHFPKNVENKLLKELVRFNKAAFGSPESAMLRTYIDTCLEIPFDKYSNDETSVKNARKILEKDHYGLEKVKERILEFIAVKEMKPDVKN